MAGGKGRKGAEGASRMVLFLFFKRNSGPVGR